MRWIGPYISAEGHMEPNSTSMPNETGGTPSCVPYFGFFIEDEYVSDELELMLQFQEALDKDDWSCAI